MKSQQLFLIVVLLLIPMAFAQKNYTVNVIDGLTTSSGDPPPLNIENNQTNTTENNTLERTLVNVIEGIKMKSEYSFSNKTKPPIVETVQESTNETVTATIVEDEPDETDDGFGIEIFWGIMISLIVISIVGAVGWYFYQRTRDTRYSPAKSEEYKT